MIASTAVISAINALTLKPAQCALWLKPKKDKKPNWFFRGFNRVYGHMEGAYIGLVTRMVKAPFIMLLVFIVIITVSAIRFAYQPTGFLPTDDQGYAIIVSRLPDGASQPRAKAVYRKVSDILKKEPGLLAWVTIGGFSILDNANVSNINTTFIVYKPWDERGADLTQDKILASLRPKLAKIEEAMVFVVVPPPIRGLGQSGGFQMMIEDRQNLGLAELQKAVLEVIRAGSAQSGLQNLVTTFSARSPQLYLDINRTKVQSLQIPMINVFETLQAYLGSTFVNFFNKFNQVFQVYVQADAPLPPAAGGYQELVRQEHAGGDGASGHPDGYPAGPGFGTGDPLQSLSRRGHYRGGGAGLQHRPGPDSHGAGGGPHPAPGHGL